VRILVTVPWGERLGGAEAMLQMVLDGAREAGHEFELVFLQDGPWVRELAQAGFAVHVVPVGRLRQAHRTLLALPRLARIMRRSGPDVIVNWSAKTQIYGAPAALLAGLSDRVVWWQQVIPRGHWIDRAATALPAIAVVCYSQAAAREQARMRPHRPTIVIAAGTPVPAPVRGRPALELPGGVPVIGLVGRLQQWKGQDRLLRAQQILAERGVRTHVLIVGGDSYGLEPDYARSLKPLSEQLGLADAVTMTGEVPDASPYIERMDVLVNASDPEPFGIVLLEAMARGVAVAAVASGGPAEFIEDGRTGMLARSGSPADLADALEPLLRSPDKRWTIGAAGHKRFLEEFTDAAMRDRFFFQINKLINEKKD